MRIHEERKALEGEESVLKNSLTQIEITGPGLHEKKSQELKSKI